MIEYIYGHLVLNPGLLVASIIIGFIALVSQMALYAKAGQNPWTALVPVVNVIVFCKVVGRPAKHSLFLILPGVVMAGAAAAYWPIIDGLFPIHGPEDTMLPGPSSFSDALVPFVIIGLAAVPLTYIMIQMFAEVAESFGKHRFIDKVMCVVFNGIYILFVLGISNTLYESGWYARKRGKKYYMPDFKHKGKKFLVTPDSAVIKDSDWKKDKLTVKVVDKSDNSIWNDSDPGDGPELIIEGTANFQKVVERKVLAINEALEAGESIEDLVKDKPKETVTDEKKKTEAVEEKKVKPALEKKVEQLDKESKKEEPEAEKTKVDKNDSSIKKGGKLADTQKRFSKKASDGKSKDTSGKTWRDEMLEKYKKK
jgi:hypothetical protein